MNDLTNNKHLRPYMCNKGMFSAHNGQIPLQKIGLTTTCMATQNDERMIGLRGFEIKYTPSCGKGSLFLPSLCLVL